MTSSLRWISSFALLVVPLKNKPLALLGVLRPLLSLLSLSSYEGRDSGTLAESLQQAADEEDPRKLVEIYKDIICMLDEKALRLFTQWEPKPIQTKPN